MDSSLANRSPDKDLLAEMTSHKDSGVELADLDLIDWILDDEPMFPEEELLPSSSDISNHFAAEPHVMPVSPDASVLNESEASKVLPSPIKLSVPVTSSPGTSVKHYQLRTDLKMQLQRDKALNEKRREEISGKNIGKSSQSSHPVNIQLATTPLQVASQPGQNVNKGSVLANPTLYHLQAIAKAEGGGKMGRYSNACGGGGSVPPGYASTTAMHNGHGFNSLGAPGGKVILHGSAPPNVYSGIDSVPASPLHPESVRSVNSVTSGCSDNTSEYPTNDDLLNEGLGTIQLTDGQDSKNSVVSLPPQFPSGGGTTGRGHFGEGRLRVKGSSSATARSCPTATDQISPESQDKDRKKKDNHNKIEQNRRKKINECIFELSTELPKPGEDHFDKVGELKTPISKGAVLSNTVQYVKELKKENSDVKKENNKLKQELQEVKSELQIYKEICQSKGIVVPLKMEPQIKQEPVPFEDKTFLSCDLQLLEPWPMDHDAQDVFQGNGNVMLGGGHDDPVLSRPPTNDLTSINDNMEFT